MFKFNKLFVATLIFASAINFCKTNDIEVINIEKNITVTNPVDNAVLTLLEVKKSDTGGFIYTYKCSVSTQESGRLACIANNNTSWNSIHDAELKLRCPNSGNGVTLSYAEILFAVTNPNVKCYVNEGAVGLGYIGITVNAWNTLLFNYWAYFYN